MPMQRAFRGSLQKGQHLSNTDICLKGCPGVRMPEGLEILCAAIAMIALAPTIEPYLWQSIRAFKSALADLMISVGASAATLQRLMLPGW